MELDEIKRQAQDAAKTLEIQWDNLERDPSERAYFERVLSDSVKVLPDIEYAYTHVRDGKSVVNPNESSSISYEDRERFMTMLEDRLFEVYQIADLWERYTLIKSITEISKNDIQ